MNGPKNLHKQSGSTDYLTFGMVKNPCVLTPKLAMSKVAELGLSDNFVPNGPGVRLFVSDYGSSLDHQGFHGTMWKEAQNDMGELELHLIDDVPNVGGFVAPTEVALPAVRDEMAGIAGMEPEIQVQPEPAPEPTLDERIEENKEEKEGLSQELMDLRSRVEEMQQILDGAEQYTESMEILAPKPVNMGFGPNMAIQAGKNDIGSSVKAIADELTSKLHNGKVINVDYRGRYSGEQSSAPANIRLQFPSEMSQEDVESEITSVMPQGWALAKVWLSDMSNLGLPPRWLVDIKQASKKQASKKQASSIALRSAADKVFGSIPGVVNVDTEVSEMLPDEGSKGDFEVRVSVIQDEDVPDKYPPSKLKGGKEATASFKTAIEAAGYKVVGVEELPNATKFVIKQASKKQASLQYLVVDVRTMDVEIYSTEEQMDAYEADSGDLIAYSKDEMMDFVSTYPPDVHTQMYDEYADVIKQFWPEFPQASKKQASKKQAAFRMDMSLLSAKWASLWKQAEPPPPEGVTTEEWDKELEKGPDKIAAGHGRYPGGMDPPKWLPHSMRDIWRYAVERTLEEAGADPDDPESVAAALGDKPYAKIVPMYKHVLQKYAPDVPVSMPHAYSEQKKPWEKETSPEVTEALEDIKTMKPTTASLLKQMGLGKRDTLEMFQEVESALKEMMKKWNENKAKIPSGYHLSESLDPEKLEMLAESIARTRLHLVGLFQPKIMPSQGNVP